MTIWSTQAENAIVDKLKSFVCAQLIVRGKTLNHTFQWIKQNCHCPEKADYYLGSPMIWIIHVDVVMPRSIRKVTTTISQSALSYPYRYRLHHHIIVGELMCFRGYFMKKASHWSSYAPWTIRNPKDVVDNFEKDYFWRPETWPVCSCMITRL